MGAPPLLSQPSVFLLFSFLPATLPCLVPRPAGSPDDNCPRRGRQLSCPRVPAGGLGQAGGSTTVFRVCGCAPGWRSTLTPRYHSPRDQVQECSSAARSLTTRSWTLCLLVGNHSARPRSETLCVLGRRAQALESDRHRVKAGSSFCSFVTSGKFLKYPEPPFPHL